MAVGDVVTIKENGDAVPSPVSVQRRFIEQPDGNYSEESVLGPSESHIGQVDGGGTTIHLPITVDTAAYAIGDDIGGKLTLTNVNRAAGKAVLLTDLVLVDRSNQKPVGSLIIFDSDPTAATITDQAAFVSSTDDTKIIGVIPIAAGDWVTIGTKAFAHLRNLGVTLQPAGTGRNLYAAFVAAGAPDFVAATDLHATPKFMYA